LDELLLQDAHNLHKPIFGICYGMQSLNVWRTGTLVQHLHEKPVNHEAGSKVLQAHQVEIEPGTLLQRLAQATTVSVNSSHHQAVDQHGDGLKISARSPQDGVIEAVEGTAPDHWIVAVQWHPERTFATEPLSHRLFEEFARAVKQWKPRVVTDSVAHG
jgi:putative glutamine amidotransferase